MTTDPKTNEERIPDFFHSGNLKLLENSRKEFKLIESGKTEEISDEILEIFDEDLKVSG